MFSEIYDDNLLNLKSSMLTIGTFDGVHLGHQKIIRNIVKLGKENNIPSVVYTFDPPPKAHFGGAKILTNIDEKLEKISSFCPDFIIVAKFDNKYSSKPAIDFCTEIKQLNPKQLWVGDDFRFGNKRLGDIEFLKQFFSVKQFPEITCKKGIRISSSRLRLLFEQGENLEAHQLLGW